MVSSLKPKTILLVGFTLTAWLLTHRYVGIAHDGVFYAGQSINRISPQGFTDDLFFAFGSQDDFTWFTAAYGCATQQLGLPRASVALLAIGQSAWLAAAAWLLRKNLAGFSYWLALILLIAIPRGYGSQNLLRYAEPFLTARVWAEALTLLGVAFAVRGRYGIATLVSLLAASLHPIIALAGIMFIGCCVWQDFARVFPRLCIAASAVLLTLAFEAVLFLPVMDETWLNLALDRTPFTFLAAWESNEYFEPLLLVTVLALAAFCDGKEWQRFWIAGFGVFLCGAVLSLLPIAWPVALLVQMQPWRVLWLIKVLAIVAGARLVCRYAPGSPLNRLLIGAFLACALNIDQLPSLLGAMFLAVLFWLHSQRGFSPHIPSSLRRLSWAVLLGVVVAKVLSLAQLAPVKQDLWGSTGEALSEADHLFAYAEDLGWFIFPSLLALLFWIIMQRPRLVHYALILVLGGLAFAVTHWDGRTAAQRSEEAIWVTGIPELARILEPDDLVYWSGGYTHLWFGLRRGNYASRDQAAGLVFSRQTAIEAKRRLGRLARLGVSDAQFSWFPKQTSEAPVQPSLPGLIHVCHDPILDYVVLPTVLPEARIVSFKLYDTQRLLYQVYDCALLRHLPDPYPEPQ